MADSSDNLLKKLIREIHRRSISQVLPILASLTAAGLALEAHEARAQVPSPSPTILVDVGHNNVLGRGGPPAALIDWLGSEGYRVLSFSESIDAAVFQRSQILILAMALSETNAFPALPLTDEELAAVWRLPTPSAYSEDEVAAVAGWVAQVGGLLLVFDHMPLSGAAQDLASAFGIEIANGLTVDQTVLGDAQIPSAVSQAGSIVFRRSDGSLAAHVVTDGGSGDTRIDSIATFVGSAFRLPTDGASLLTLGPTFVTLLPEWHGNLI